MRYNSRVHTRLIADREKTIRYYVLTVCLDQFENYTNINELLELLETTNFREYLNLDKIRLFDKDN